MSHARFAFALLAGAAIAGLMLGDASAQQTYPGPRELPNPYRLEKWPTIPANMNGGKWAR